MNQIVITCEHYGNLIPQAWEYLFLSQQKILQTHQGYDIGIGAVYDLLVEQISCSHFCFEYSRLLVDVNRSLVNPEIFSFISKELYSKEREKIIKKLYLPYRKEIEKTIDGFIKKKYKVFHLALHSFTPVLHGEERTADIGILFNPQRSLEKKTAQLMRRIFPVDYCVKLNYPYQGISDGLPSYLRECFEPKMYLAIELEINQKWLIKPESEDFINSLLEKLTSFLQSFEL